MSREANNAAVTEISAAGHVYSLLARLWLCEVDGMLIDSLTDTELGQAWQDLGGAVPARSEIEELETEYCQLFVGPKNHLAPFQSVWESGQLESEIASSVSRFANLLHYRVPPQYPNTMIDHLGVQLDLMGNTMTRLASEIGSNPEAMAGEVLSEFFARHLTWPDRLLQASGQRATSSFYQSMIAITSEFLKSQRELWSPNQG